MFAKVSLRHKVACSLLVALLAFAFALSSGFSSVLAPPQQAFAQDSRTWTYVGSKAFKEDYDPFYPGYGSWCVPHTTVTYDSNSYHATSIGMREDGKTVIGEYQESYEWSNPPTTIFVGDEAAASINVTIEWSYKAREESESWSPGTGYPSFSASMNLYEFVPNGADTGPFSKNSAIKNTVVVAADGQTEFPEAQELGGISMDPGQWITLGNMVSGSLSNPVTDGLDTWDEGDPITEISRSTSESVSAWDTSSPSWKYGRELAKGNYKISAGDHYHNYNGPGNYEASAYLLVIRVSAGHSTYTRDYYYTFFPNEAEPEPVATTTESTEKPTKDPENVVIETEPSKESGESGGWVIPAAIVGVAVVGGAGAVLLRGRKKGGDSGGDDDGPDDDQPQNPSTFRMLLWKGFGDTLYAGGTAQEVGARIEEVRPDGTVVRRDDLTASITFAVSDNIAARAMGMKGAYQSVEVQAASAEAAAGIVSMKFSGEGGTFTNNVHFKIEPLEIVFAEDPLTFVAGKNQTFQMPFKFSQEDIAEKSKPTFSVKLTGARAGENFSYKRVVLDPQFPDKLFAVELAECGSITKDDVPGTMEDYICEVVAMLPAAESRQETTIRGQFHFFRFHEGLRFTCEPLKCYLVKHVENDDVYVSSDEMLDAAMGAQAMGVGLAGGMVAGIGARTVLRETARDLKERFPELYKEDDPYLFDKRDKVMLTPGRTHAYATLYVVETYPGPDGRTFQRPCTPLPARDNVQLAFADVPGSSVLVDKDGKEARGPVDELDFASFVSDIKRTDNTVTFEILPTKGVMTPPNRAQVDVTCVVTYTDQSGNERSFMETQRVNAISQPYRIDYVEKFKEYQAADDEVQDMLRSIQARILNSNKYRGGLAKKASVSLTEAALDGIADAQYDGNQWGAYYALRLNPVTGVGIGLYELYKGVVGFSQSVKRQWNSDVYFDDLSPIAYRIESMIEGHDYAFGFFEPEVKQIVTTFARFESGELGSAESVDLAYHGRDMLFADALRMTVQDWNHSWTAIGVRIGFAFITFGESEWLFMPLAAISSGLEGSLDYIDRGGDSLLEAYRVGCSDAGKQLLLEGAMAIGVGATVKCVKWAGVLTKEAIQQRQLYAKALSEMFSSARYSKAVLGAANVVETMIAKSSSLTQAAMHTALKPFRSAAKVLYERISTASADKVDDIIRAYRGGATVGAENVEREIAYVLGRMEGGVKVDALRQLMKSGGKGLSIYEKRAVAIAIQSDKHAMRAMLEAGDNEVIAYFNRIMGDIEEKAIQKTREALYSRFGGKVPMDKIRVKGTSGNAASDVMAGRKLPMDLDVTFEYWDDAAGAYKDVRAALGQECFDAEFYRIVKGYAAETDDVARMFARSADMTVTDAFHPEAYSPEYRDALRVIDKNLAGEKFTHVEQVGKVAEYKCVEWLNLSKRMLADSRAARAAGKIADAQGLAALSEACAEEAARQFTKQADRLIVNRLSYLYSKGVRPQTSVNIDSFLSKVAVLKRSGMGRFGGTGLTSGEIDAVLEGGFQTNAETLYHELNTLTVELTNALDAVL